MPDHKRAVLGVYVLLVALGAPIWLSIVAVQREPLPHESMVLLPDLVHNALTQTPHTCGSHVSIAVLTTHPSVSLAAANSACAAQSWCSTVQALNPAVDLQVDDIELESVLLSTVQQAKELANSFVLFILDAPKANAKNLTQSLVVGSNCAWIRDSNQGSLDFAKILAEIGAKLQYVANLHSDADAHTIQFPSQPHFRLLLTLVNTNPDQWPTSWEPDTIISSTLQPFVTSLSSVFSMDIETQLVFGHSLPSQFISTVHNSNKAPQTTISLTDLPAAVSSAHWPIETSPSTINLVLYLVPDQSTPMHLEMPSGAADSAQDEGFWGFVLPRWGGVVVVNRVEGPSQVLTATQLEPAVQLFVSQIRQLIGLSPHHTGHVQCPEGVCGWEVNALRDVYTRDLMSRSAKHLSALSALVSSLSALPVTNEVASHVENSVRDLEEAIEILKSAQKCHNDATARMLQLAQQSEQASLWSLHHPDMIPQLYMEWDRKLAIYAPFFLPFTVKLLVCAKNLFIPSRKPSAVS